MPCFQMEYQKIYPNATTRWQCRQVALNNILFGTFSGTATEDLTLGTVAYSFFVDVKEEHLETQDSVLHLSYPSVPYIYSFGLGFGHKVATNTGCF